MPQAGGAFPAVAFGFVDGSRSEPSRGKGHLVLCRRDFSPDNTVVRSVVSRLKPLLQVELGIQGLRRFIDGNRSGHS